MFLDFFLVVSAHSVKLILSSIRNRMNQSPQNANNVCCSFHFGEDYYKVFTECVDILASEDEYDNPNSLESKKIQALNSAKACAVMSKSITEKMFKCNDVQLMGKLNEALRCIWELMQEYRDKISFTRMGSLILQQIKYRPLLLESRQHDCRALLVDIEIFCRNVTRFFVMQLTSLNCTRQFGLRIPLLGSFKM